VWNKLFENYLKSYIKTLQILGLAEWKKDFERSKVLNRSLVVLDEAKKRQIPVEVLHIGGEPRRFFRAYLPAKRIFFEIMPLAGSYRRFSQDRLDHKIKIKKELKRMNIPVVDSFVFDDIYKAKYYLEKRRINFPLVVKPLGGSLSKGVTTGIESENEFIRAIKKARKYALNFIVERHISGDCFRSTLVNFKHIATVKRIPANVVGTGRHSVRDLVAVKNLDERRGDKKRKDTTLHKLYIGKVAKKLLRKQGLSPKSIIEKGRRVYLHTKITVVTGADLFDVTDEVYPGTVLMLENIARNFDSRVLGIDIVARDISEPLGESNGAIIELNSFPYIDMHHFPTQGKPRNVAGAIWEMVLENSKIKNQILR